MYILLSTHNGAKGCRRKALTTVCATFCLSYNDGRSKFVHLYHGWTCDVVILMTYSTGHINSSLQDAGAEALLFCRWKARFVECLYI